MWILALLAVAVGVTLLARYSNGYVLVLSPPWRVEFSLNFLLVALAAAFAVCYTLVRTLSATVRLPRQVRQYRAARRRERGRSALMEALREYFAGRFGRAEKAAATALECGENTRLAAVLAARAAHRLRGWDRRDAYLERARADDEESAMPGAITEIELLVEQHHYDEALERLKALPHRHTAALRLELKAQQRTHNWDRVIVLAAELEKRGVFDAEQAGQIRRFAIAEGLKRKGLDAHALGEVWRKVAQKDRVNHRVAHAAAQCFAAAGECARAHRIIEDAVAAEWDADLVRLYADCDGGDTVARIERAEKWLKAHPQDAALLLALGRLCGQAELWGKAQSYVDASIAIEGTYTAHLEAAKLAEQRDDAEGAQRHYRQSLDLALAQLKSATGGRRRIPL